MAAVNWSTSLAARLQRERFGSGSWWLVTDGRGQGGTVSPWQPKALVVSYLRWASFLPCGSKLYVAARGKDGTLECRGTRQA